MRKTLSSQFYFENDALKLQGGVLTFKYLHKEVCLKGNGLMLIVCLLNKVHDKKSIMSFIWSRAKNKACERYYNHLVHSLRAKLERNGIPRNTLVTLPHFGVCLDSKLLAVTQKNRKDMASIVNDHAAYL